VPDTSGRVEEEIHLEVQVGAFGRDAFAGVRAVAERADGLAALNRLVDRQAVGNAGEVRVESVHFDAVPAVRKDDVAAVVGEAGPNIDEGDCTIGGGQDEVGGLAATVTVETTNVHAFVEPGAVATDATELARLDGAFDGRLIEVRLTTAQQCIVAGWQTDFSGGYRHGQEQGSQ
jgi:hypothetical protein